MDKQTPSPCGIAFTETGGGEPVVLIHCSSASGREWTSLGESLADRFRAIAADQWGCGASAPWVGQEAFTLAAEAAPLRELIAGIGGPVHLLGHSYGGGVALRIARECPGAVRSLTLIEPSSFHLLKAGGRKDIKLFREIAGLAGVVGRAVASGGYWAGMECFFDYWNGEGAWAAIAHKARLKLAQSLPKVMLDFRALFEEQDGLADYAGMTMPTLLLRGELPRSREASLRIVEMLAGAMPNARVERIAGAGHMAPLTHPEVVNEAVRRHLLAVSRIDGLGRAA